MDMAWINSWLMLWWKLVGKVSAGGVDVVDAQTEQMAGELIEEIRQAHREWANAQRHFEYALGKDQIDYTIFAMEAAEKRYEMLLRNAKSLPVNWSVQRGADAG
jgi:hypothetical protein